MQIDRGSPATVTKAPPVGEVQFRNALPDGLLEVALALSLTERPLVLVPFATVVDALVRLKDPSDDGVPPEAGHVPLAEYSVPVMVAATGDTDVCAWTVLLASVKVA